MKEFNTPPRHPLGSIDLISLLSCPAALCMPPSLPCARARALSLSLSHTHTLSLLLMGDTPTKVEGAAALQKKKGEGDERRHQIPYSPGRLDIESERGMRIEKKEKEEE